MLRVAVRFEQAQHRRQFDGHVPSSILVAVVVAVAFLDLGLDAEGFEGLVRRAASLQ